MKWIVLLALVSICWAKPTFAGEVMDDLARGWRYANFDTTITTSVGSTDTVYFGAVAKDFSIEVRSFAITFSFHQDYRPLPVFGKLNAGSNWATIPYGPRSGISLVEKTKTWTIDAGATGAYDDPVSGCIIRGTGSGSVHVHAKVRVK